MTVTSELHAQEYRSTHKEKRWFVLKIPRGDTDGVGEDEVTVPMAENIGI